MILSRFKRKNIKNKMESKHKNSIENRHSFGAKVKSVLILIDESIDKKMGETISDELSLVHSNIQILTFKDKIEKGTSSESWVTERDFGLFGNLRNEDIKKIVCSEVDLLVNYIVDNHCLNSLVVISDALFKVGFSDDKTLIYDLMIDVDKNDFNVFNSELKKYLKILNKI